MDVVEDSEQNLDIQLSGYVSIGILEAFVHMRFSTKIICAAPYIFHIYIPYNPFYAKETSHTT